MKGEDLKKCRFGLHRGKCEIKEDERVESEDSESLYFFNFICRMRSRCCLRCSKVGKSAERMNVPTYIRF